MGPHSRRKPSVKSQCRWKIEHALTAYVLTSFERIFEIDFSVAELVTVETLASILLLDLRDV